MRIVASRAVTLTALVRNPDPRVVTESVLASVSCGSLEGDPEYPAVLVRSAGGLDLPQETQVLWIVGDESGADQSRLLACLSLSRVPPATPGPTTDDAGSPWP